MDTPPPAPDWHIDTWLNASADLDLGALRGKVIYAVAFQMLCPGCVSHGLPQAQRARQLFSSNDLAVVGLHTVFEHHDAQGGPAPLRAFLHEYRITFPVGIDAREGQDPLPLTMRAYAMRGTPTTILIDREGRLRLQHFGHLEDMQLGAAVATLVREAPLATRAAADGAVDSAPSCDADGCVPNEPLT
jgi:hypothetical protein